MVRFLLLCTFFISLTFAAKTEEYYWEKGETLLKFLEKNELPFSLYYGLDYEDKEVASEIYSGTKYYILKGDEDDIRQVLIPVGGGELQLHIYKEKDDNYSISLTPVAYQEEVKELVFDMQVSPYQDIITLTNSNLLAHEFVNSFQGSVDFSRLRAGTSIVVIYKQKIRLGMHFTNPTIIAGMVESKSSGKKDYVFYYEPKGRYYNNEGKEILGYFLITPVQYTRISSPFTLKRWHPVLKKYRAHLGIDYAAPIGTPVKAAGDGKVTFVGTQNGYGKTVKINHEGGYSTLYAHLNGFAKSLKSGSYVKKGQVIAYVGNTGVSTGPHLHFGLYKNNQPINPSSVIKVAKSALTGKEKADFNEYAKSMRTSIDAIRENPEPVQKEEQFVYSVNINGQ
ncbi:MAG: peptidoglycan DD-metalloendopeptidase family protein [Campylobacteraceae bacterium]|jgi:murein DD-endopeptidase MepM/ murein hydrolase activator NlpD|nr:peptidoglycan DD-metalloendopeptidase family protein [Campylobacteraceae bacterium]